MLRGETTIWINELTKRRVFRVVAGYAVVCFITLQIADVTFEPLGIGNSVLKIIIAVMLLALPLVAYLSWVFDIGPEDEVHRVASDKPWLEASVTLLALLGLGVGCWMVLMSHDSVERPQPLSGGNSTTNTDPLAVREPRSIAVLPFADMSPDGDQEYFGDGIAEELLNELVRLDGLRVAGRISSFSFKGTNATHKEIAEALRVESILEGSIRKDGSRVRITAKLINAVNGYHLWSKTYDRELANIFSIQEEIATAVSGALGVKLGVGGVNAFHGAGTQNIEAYEAFLQGTGLDPSNRESIRFFERAVQLDPNYSAGWTRLGISTLATMWTSNPEEAPEIIERAYDLVLRAVELDPDSAQAISRLGMVLFTKKDWIGSEEANARALSVLSDRQILGSYGAGLMRSGRSVAALEQWEKAEAIEPMGGRLVNFRVHVALAQGRYADAREVLVWSPEPQRTDLKIVLALNEGDSESIKATIKAMTPTDISTTALYYPVLSVFDSTEKVLSILRASYADKGSRWNNKPYDIALLAAYFGDPELALQVLGETVRNTPVRLQTVWYPVMSEVRKLPGFKVLVSDLNLVAYWRAFGWADLCRPVGDDDFECI